MVKRIEFEGEVHEFPDDFTDAEISGALRRAGERRTAVGRERQMRAPQGRPGTFLRGLEDFNREGLGGIVSQAWRQVPFADEASGLVARGGQMVENALRGTNVDPSAAATAAQQVQDEERVRFAQQHPGGDAAATAMNVIGLAGTPTAALPRISMLQGGAAAAGINAPFALARQEGSLEERLHGALQETAVVGGLGSGLTGLSNVFARQAPRSGQVASAMSRLGVPENLATASRNPITRSLTRVASENFVTGPLVRGRLTRSLEGTRDAAQRLSQQYGNARGKEGAGRTVLNAVDRYVHDGNIPNPNPGANPLSVSTREWSLASKARAVYDHALRPIEGNAAQLNRTRAVIQNVMSRADDPAVVAFREDPVLRQFINTVGEVQAPTLRDVRELRRAIREAQNRPGLDGQSVDNASLQRLEAALTEDMYAAAGPAADSLRRADQFYRNGRERLESALQAIGGRNATPAQAYNAILRAANRQTPNAQALVNLRRAVRDSEWRDVAASIIDNMGAVPARRSGVGADINFSVEEFTAAYRNMTPQARRILFGQNARRGGRALMQDLDDLAEIASQQRAIESMGTPSGRDVQNAIMGAGAVTSLPATAAAVLFLGVSGEMLTNPAFVRWLTSASRPGARAGGLRGSLSALGQIAARDPAIVPYYEALLARYEAGQSPAPATRQVGSR